MSITVRQSAVASPFTNGFSFSVSLTANTLSGGVLLARTLIVKTISPPAIGTPSDSQGGSYTLIGAEQALSSNALHVSCFSAPIGSAAALTLTTNLGFSFNTSNDNGETDLYELRGISGAPTSTNAGSDTSAIVDAGTVSVTTGQQVIVDAFLWDAGTLTTPAGWTLSPYGFFVYSATASGTISVPITVNTSVRWMGHIAVYDVASDAPVVVSAVTSTDGSQITVTFDKSVTAGAGGNGGMALTSTGGACTLTYASGDPSTAIVFRTSRQLRKRERNTLAFTQPGNGWEATSGGTDVASFSSQPVINISTATEPHGYSELTIDMLTISTFGGGFPSSIPIVFDGEHPSGVVGQYKIGGGSWTNATRNSQGAFQGIMSAASRSDGVYTVATQIIANDSFSGTLTLNPISVHVANSLSVVTATAAGGGFNIDPVIDANTGNADHLQITVGAGDYNYIDRAGAENTAAGYLKLIGTGSTPVANFITSGAGYGGQTNRLWVENFAIGGIGYAIVMPAGGPAHVTDQRIVVKGCTFAQDGSDTGNEFWRSYTDPDYLAMTYYINCHALRLSGPLNGMVMNTRIDGCIVGIQNVVGVLDAAVIESIKYNPLGHNDGLFRDGQTVVPGNVMFLRGYTCNDPSWPHPVLNTDGTSIQGRGLCFGLAANASGTQVAIVNCRVFQGLGFANDFGNAFDTVDIDNLLVKGSVFRSIAFPANVNYDPIFIDTVRGYTALGRHETNGYTEIFSNPSILTMPWVMPDGVTVFIYHPQPSPPSGPLDHTKFHVRRLGAGSAYGNVTAAVYVADRDHIIQLTLDAPVTPTAFGAAPDVEIFAAAGAYQGVDTTPNADIVIPLRMWDNYSQGTGNDIEVSVLGPVNVGDLATVDYFLAFDATGGTITLSGTGFGYSTPIIITAGVVGQFTFTPTVPGTLAIAFTAVDASGNVIAPDNSPFEVAVIPAANPDTGGTTITLQTQNIDTFSYQPLAARVFENSNLLILRDIGNAVDNAYELISTGPGLFSPNPVPLSIDNSWDAGLHYLPFTVSLPGALHRVSVAPSASYRAMYQTHFSPDGFNHLVSDLDYIECTVTGVSIVFVVPLTSTSIRVYMSGPIDVTLFNPKWLKDFSVPNFGELFYPFRHTLSLIQVVSPTVSDWETNVGDFAGGHQVGPYSLLPGSVVWQPEPGLADDRVFVTQTNTPITVNPSGTPTRLLHHAWHPWLAR